MLFVFCRAYEEYQVETVYESVADLQFTHMASALIADTRGENHVKCTYANSKQLETQLVRDYARIIIRETECGV